MYVVEENLSTNEVCAVVGAALLQDLLSNNFTFEGIPRVTARWQRPHFVVSLALESVTAGPLLLSATQVRRALRRLRQGVHTGLIDCVQPLVTELERMAKGLRTASGGLCAR